MKFNRRDVNDAVVIDVKGQLTGGPEALKATIEAIEDAGRWWP